VGAMDDDGLGGGELWAPLYLFLDGKLGDKIIESI